ncbi:MAG: ASCH domain-containing protein [Bacilli bacterium]|nr:ASCH domain-containing protein [Bacilli bacterium]
MNEIINNYWYSFLTKNNLKKSTLYYEAFSFGSNKIQAKELLDLVIDGKKRATASAKPLYEMTNTPLPKPGDYSIVLDENDVPKCVIMTTKVIIIPFKEMTYEICSQEGEDECLESWQNNHRKFFTKEGEKNSFSFSDDMEVVFENFKVVYK